MNKIKLLLISILLISCNNAVKETPKENVERQQKIVPKTPDFGEFIPNEYEIVASGDEPIQAIADLNNDGISDYVVLLARGKNDEGYANADSVLVAIFEGQSDGSFKLEGQTGNLTAAFIHYLSAEIVQVSHTNIISLKHQSMRHDYELKLRYETTYEDYMLIGAEYNNYGNAAHNGAGNISTDFIAGKRISTIDGKKTTNVDRELKPISVIDDYNIYELISE